MKRMALGVLVLLVVAGAAQAVTVSITTTTDDYYTLYVDGGFVGSVASPGYWPTIQSFTLPTLAAGTHEILIEGHNFVATPGDSSGRPGPGEYNPAGVLFQMTDSGLFGEAGPLGDHNLIVSDGSWQVSTTNLPGSWTAATAIAVNGTGPWAGPLAGISTSAYWIWSDHNDVSPAGAGTADSLVYLRREFTVVPEPVTMFSAFMAISGLGMYIRKRTRA